MTMRGTYRTLTGTPVPITAREQAGYKSGKIMLSVDFKTGEIKWDEEMEDKMGFKVEVSKVDFLRAINNNRTQAGAIRELNIGVGSFYKYKKMWAKDIAEMDKPKPFVNPEFEKAVREMEEAVTAKKIEPVVVEAAEEIHIPTMAETESFFGESTFNPEEPKKEEGKRVNVLEAIDLMDEAREEAYCVTCIFDQRICITPDVRRLLENHQNQSEMIVDEIERKLGELTITL